MLPGKFQYVVMVENRLFKPPYTKNSTEGEGSPAVEHGLSMCETLSSIPSIEGKKKAQINKPSHIGRAINL